jgi:hypothetical protein
MADMVDMVRRMAGAEATQWWYQILQRIDMVMMSKWIRAEAKLSQQEYVKISTTTDSQTRESQPQAKGDRDRHHDGYNRETPANVGHVLAYGPFENGGQASRDAALGACSSRSGLVSRGI